MGMGMAGGIGDRYVLTLVNVGMFPNNRVLADYFKVKVNRRTLSVHTVGSWITTSGRRYTSLKAAATFARAPARTKVKSKAENGHCPAARPQSPDGDTLRRELEGCC